MALAGEPMRLRFTSTAHFLGSREGVDIAVERGAGSDVCTVSLRQKTVEFDAEEEDEELRWSRQPWVTLQTAAVRAREGLVTDAVLMAMDSADFLVDTHGRAALWMGGAQWLERRLPRLPGCPTDSDDPVVVQRQEEAWDEQRAEMLASPGVARMLRFVCANDV